MKKIKAIIRPYKLDEVHEALNQAGFNSRTISEIKGYGKQESQNSVYRGKSYNIEL
jgi:nitrogen regulatory protein PII